MNFGSFTNYLSSSIGVGASDSPVTAPAPSYSQLDPPGEISDWGIEESTVHSSRHTSISINHPIAPTRSNSSQIAYNNNNTSNIASIHHHQNNNFTHSSGPYQSTNHEIINSKFYNPAYNHNPPSVIHHQPSIYNYMTPRITTQDELSLYVKRYLSLNNIVGEFWEKYKYDLIVSNLLDDSMILSKNEQMLRELKSKIRGEESRDSASSREYIKMFNDDGYKLKVLERRYNLHFPATIKGGIFQCIGLIYIALKTILSERNATIKATSNVDSSVMKLVRIVLILSTKIIQKRRISTLLTVSKVSRKVDELLLGSYKINKKFMVNLLSIKEEEIFKFMTVKNGNSNNVTSPTTTSTNISAASLMDHTIELLISHLHKSIRTLLPYMNGPIFEKYCSVNNINWSVVLSLGEDSAEDSNNQSALLTKKLTRFNQIRKLFICQLLTMDEQPYKNFFLSKIWDDFGVDEIEAMHIASQGNLEQRLRQLFTVLDEQTKILSSMEGLFPNSQEVSEDQDLLSQPLNVTKGNTSNEMSTFNSDLSAASSSIHQLVDKLSTITTNLKFFEKYNTSTSNVTDIDELNEKLFIYNQFGQELSNIKELYQVSLSDIKNNIKTRVSGGSQNSTPASSKRNSRESPQQQQQHDREGFNLKSFHTSSTLKKRFSLPVQTEASSTGLTPTSSPIVPTSPLNSLRGNGAVNEKKYKRLSAGLPVGLLTVFEEPNGNKAVAKRRNSNRSSSSPGKSSLPDARSGTSVNGPNDSRSISYDDNYINILPPTSYYNETYNHAALEALSRKQQPAARIVSGNRYSLNSMNSNVSGISDLLASTNQTSELDETQTSPSFSQEDLKIKLEESFNRIYSLESENSKLKKQFEPLKPSAIQSEDQQEDEVLNNRDITEPAFLNQLESALNIRTRLDEVTTEAAEDNSSESKVIS